MKQSLLPRRRFIKSAASVSAMALLGAIVPTWARGSMSVLNRHNTTSNAPLLFDLNIREHKIDIAGGTATGTTINNTVPGPLLEWHEGRDVVLNVANKLTADTSIHWHGILLPVETDGVPGVTFRGIKPGTTFQYRFPVKQSGTYWYHSHSGLQEQTGVYGPLVVHPQHDKAYTVMAESMDRSGYAAGTLAPRAGMQTAVPPLRKRPLLSMVDMGMDMEQMDMGGMTMDDAPMKDSKANSNSGNASAADHAAMGHDMSKMSQVDHAAMGHDMSNMSQVDRAAMGHDMSGKDNNMHAMMDMNAGPIVARHGPDQHGPGNIGVATVERNRLGERGTGLAGVEHRVLVYNDLRRLVDDFDDTPPAREIELHLTGRMERYMWSFDGKQFHEVDGPIEFNYGERLRLTLVNDTMMNHPIHLHGMWIELENGQGRNIPRKHTINMMPAARTSALITADAPGRWAFHCHLLYHMEMGMFRVVRVS